ncbi:MAG: AAA family ATPase [Fimbriimonas sp.]
MPNLTRLLSDCLPLPADALVYEISRRVADLFSDRYVLETEDYDFDLEEYAREGRCSLHVLDDAHPQLEAVWLGREKGATLVTRNAFVEVQWRGRRLHVLTVTYSASCTQTRSYVIADDMPTAREFFSAVCEHGSRVDGQILVFRNGRWKKDAELMRQIEGARMEDLVLADDLRNRLAEDIEGFFASRELYEKLGVAWKRGVLLLGPPGNGKTHALKAIVQRLKVPCLYVRGFRAMYTQPTQNIEQVFKRARDMAPCLLILEDLDSLIHSSFLSFFLNEMDGFASNQGVLTVATTNHPERLDPALLERPSRFDRKVTFTLPKRAERRRFLAALDARRDEAMRLTETELDAVAKRTKEFSFAYLKELHLSATMAWMHEREAKGMGEVTRDLIRPLREQMRTIATGVTKEDGDDEA